MKIMKIMQKIMQTETTTDRKTDRKTDGKNRRRKGAAAAVIALAVAAAAAGTSAYASSADDTSGGFFSTVAEVFSDLLFEDTEDEAALASADSTDEAASACAEEYAEASGTDDSDDSTTQFDGITVDLFNYTQSSCGSFESVLDSSGTYPQDGHDGSFYYLIKGSSWKAYDDGDGGINNGHVFNFTAAGKTTYASSGTSSETTYLMPWNIWTGGTSNDNSWASASSGYSVAGSDTVIASYVLGSYQDIVAGLQGSDGYPVLNEDTITVRSEEYEAESLAYLFDAETSTIAEDSSDTFQSKKSYTDVDISSFLSVEDGYYVFDSDETYATLEAEEAEADEDGFYTTKGASLVTESLKDVQSNGDVSASLAETNGFFPFNSLSEQYEATANSDSALDHYFGLHMYTSFVQKDGGTASDGNDMIFEFTGDDDVWIFVDDVLVGDVGGIHDALDIIVDFATGAVILYKCDNTVQVETTIYQMYQEAFADGEVTTSTDSEGNTVWTLTATDSSGSTVSYDFVDGTGENSTATTFADDTEHTLDFYYLERGNGASNMRLKFNLVQPEPTTLHKVDQDGEAVEGAGFSMFASNEDYTELYLADGTDSVRYDPDTDSIVLWNPDTESIVGDDEDGGADSYFRIQYADGTMSGELLSIAGGNTDSDGDVALTDVNGSHIDFSLLDYTYFVLVETSTPDGYQTSADGHLYYDGNTLRTANLYTSGVYTVPGETISFSGSETAYKLDAGTNQYSTFGTTTADAGVTVDDLLDTSVSYTDADGTTVSGGGSIYGIVLMQSPDSTGETNEMYAVAGTNTDGYTYQYITYSDLTNEMARLDETYKYAAAIDELTGLYTIEIDELPGTLAQYTHYNGDAEEEYNVTYAVLLLYEDAEGNVSVLGTGDDYLSVNRAFSTTIYVTDFQNRFIVQKVDENGDAVNGATFALFTQEGIKTLLPEESGSISNLDNLTIDWDQVTVTVDEDGSYTLSDGTNQATSVQSGVTQDVSDDGINLAGVAVFNQTELSSEETNGVYYLIEVSAPAGYEKSEDVVTLFSDPEGVHANAGTEDDSVRTMVGAGRVAKSLYSYVQTITLTNESDSENPVTTTYHNTLTDITIQKLAGTYNGTVTSDTVSIQDFTWTAAEGANSSTNVTYSPDEEKTPIEYGPLTQDDTAGLWSDAGWSSVSITQYYTDEDGEINPIHKINLTSSADEYDADVDITELFNHSVLIQVSDESTAGLEVTNEVTVADASFTPAEETFAFTLTLDEGYTFGSEVVQASDVNGFLIYTDAEGNTYYYNAVPTTGALFKNGTTDEVDSGSYTTGTDEETGFLTITLKDEDGEDGEELTAETTTLYYYTYTDAETSAAEKVCFEAGITYDVTTMDSEGNETTTSVTEDAELTVMKDGSPADEGEEGDAASFYLKNGQTIHFYGLENKVGYTVTETGIVSSSSDDTSDDTTAEATEDESTDDDETSATALSRAKSALVSLFGLDDDEDEAAAAAADTEDDTDDGTSDDTASDSTTTSSSDYGVCGTAHTSHSVEAELNAAWTLVNRYTYYDEETETEGKTVYTTESDSTTEGEGDDAVTTYYDAPKTISGEVTWTTTGETDPTDRLVFENEYEAASTTLDSKVFTAQKIQTGRAFREGDTYTFVLAAVNNGEMPEAAVTDGDGTSVIYMQLQVTEDAEGNLVYTVYAVGADGNILYQTDDEGDAVTDEDGNEIPVYSETLDLTSTTDEDGNTTCILSAFGFGDITYTKAGTFTYTIYEVEPDADDDGSLPGVDYSHASYTVTVVVTDDGVGNLSVSSSTVTMTQTDDQTGSSTEVEVEDKNASFENEYTTDDDTVSILVYKDYVDESSITSLTAGMFSYTLEAVGGFANVTDLSSVDFASADIYTIAASAVPVSEDADANGTDTDTNGTDGRSSFTQITYELSENTGYTYVYKLTEIGSSASFYDGLTYDTTVYYVAVVNTTGQDEDGTDIIVSTAYYFKEVTTTTTDETTGETTTTTSYEQVEPGSNQAGLEVTYATFTNTYEVKDAASVTIQGQKTLDGITLDADDTGFDFCLATTDTATLEAINTGDIVYVTSTTGEDGETTATEKNLTVGSATGVIETETVAVEADAEEGTTLTGVQSFRFDELTFKTGGTYVFTVYEDTTGLTNGSGYMYDSHVATVTIVVDNVTNDSGQYTGALRIESITYDNSSSAVSSDAANTGLAAFTNIYRTVDYDALGGFTITKNFRTESDLTNSTSSIFAFEIEAQDYSVTATDEETDVETTTVVTSASDAAKILNISGTTTGEGDDAVTTYTKTVTTSSALQLTSDQKSATAAIDFADIIGEDTEILFTQDDVGKTYTYKITETDLGAVGYTYDSSYYRVTIAVTDVDGTLAVATTIRHFRSVTTENEDGSTITTETEITDDGYPAESVVTSDTTADSEIGLAFENTYTEPAPVKTVMDSATKEAITTALVGQQMTYSIAYRNLGEEPGEIIITDTVPAGTQLVEGSISDEGSYTYDEATGKIVWTLTDVPAGYEGTVSFDVTVTEEAIEYDEINNTAAVQLGENDPEINTNTTSVNVSSSGIRVTKSVEGVLADENDLFTFTISLKDAYGNSLTNTYSYTGTLDGTEEIGGTICDGGSFCLKDGGTITIEKLPEGTQYEITETDAKGYTTAITVNGETVQTASGTTTVNEIDEADFTNTYTSSMSTPVSLDALFTKILTGRDWTEDDAFAFVIEAVTADAPLPEETTVTVTSDTAKNGEAVEFGFGEITFTEDDMEDAALNEDGYYQKTFTYTVTEVEGDIAGIEYAANAATLTVVVTDDGEGNLSGAAYVTNSTFTNSYTSSMEFGTSGSVYLMKTLYGTTAEEGEFEFTMTAVDSDTVTAEETAEKLFGADAGLSRVYTNTALDYDGDTCFVSLYSGLDIVFDQDDAGKTFACTLSETKGGGTGYTNDDTVYTVTIRIVDHGDGYLTAVHTITDDDGNTITRSFSNDPDTVQDTSIYGPEFVNDYGARVTVGGDSEVSIEATKTLTGRSLTAGEFTYVVEDAAGNTVTTGKNAADGTIRFGEIEYTTETLAEAVENGTAVLEGDAYIFAYTVYEDTESLGAGVSAGTYSFGITVTVTDNGDGTLTAEVTYPDGASSLEFENYYQTDAVELTIDGEKYLETENSTLSTSIADLAGVFSFTIRADDAAAPLPEETTVTNDAAGNVSFGTVTYDEGCFASENTVTDADNNRSVTFTYTITENASSAGGVTNDSTAVRTFTVTVQEGVTEDGSGYVLVSASETDGTLFTFTNMYAANDTSVTLGASKILKGGDVTLADGQFTFILADADGNEIDRAVNDANGQITFSTITYSAAGIYEYRVYELDDAQEGITYDTTVYEVTVTVTDDGEGNLIAEVSSEDEDIVFTNTYTETDEDTPTTDEDTPTTDEDTPTTDEDTPTTDEDTPTTDEDTPTTDEDTPTTDEDTSTTDEDTSTTDEDTSTTDDDTPTDTTETEDDTPTDTTTTTTDGDTSTDTTTTTTDDDTSTDTTTTVSTSDGSGAGFWAILLIAAAAAITALGAGRRCVLNNK